MGISSKLQTCGVQISDLPMKNLSYIMHVKFILRFPKDASELVDWIIFLNFTGKFNSIEITHFQMTSTLFIGHDIYVNDQLYEHV